MRGARRDRQAWREARDLYAELVDGRHLLPVTLPANSPSPTAGARCFGVVPVVFAQFASPRPSIPYRTTAIGTPGFVAAVLAVETWGTRRSQRPRWSGHDAVQLALSDHGLAVDTRGGSIHYTLGQFQQFGRINLARRELLLPGPNQPASVSLRGRWIPWLAVAATWLAGGKSALRHPDLRPLRR